MSALTTPMSYEVNRARHSKRSSAWTPWHMCNADSHPLWLQVEMFTTEKALLDACVEAVRSLDPDLLIGFDVQKVCSSPFLRSSHLPGSGCAAF